MRKEYQVLILAMALSLAGCEKGTDTNGGEEANGENLAAAGNSNTGDEEEEHIPPPAPFCSWEKDYYDLELYDTKFLPPSQWHSKCVPPYAGEAVIAKDISESNGIGPPIEVTFDAQGVVASIGGVECCPRNVSSAGKGPSGNFSCRQMLVCGGTAAKEGKDGCEARLQIFLEKHWEVSVWDYQKCGIDAAGADPEYAEWSINWDGNSMGGSGGGMSSQACQNCLSSCQGYSNCCTGLGCFCESECKTGGKCAGSLIYCCGPNGDCFCWESCPY